MQGVVEIKQDDFGGFGNVHLVRKIDDGQLFAAKVSKASLQMEYHAMKRIERFVVKAREAFHDNQYLIMDWYVGQAQFIIDMDPEKSQADGEILRNIIRSLVPNLKLIRERGWLHRYIKPDNILVANERPLTLNAGKGGRRWQIMREIISDIALQLHLPYQQGNDVKTWGYLISSNDVITLDKKFHIFGNHEALDGNYINFEGCGEIFFAGITYDEIDGVKLESFMSKWNSKEKKEMGKDGIQFKLNHEVRFAALISTIIPSLHAFDLDEFRTANLSQCGCDKVTNYNENNQGCSSGSLSVVKRNCFLHKYEFVKRLGGGSFGNVHLVRNIYDGQLFAAKISKSSLQMEYHAMKELQNLAYVVKAHERFHDDQSENDYLIMDWVRHNSLSTWTKQDYVDGDTMRNFGLSCKLSSNPRDAKGTLLLCAPEVLQKNLQNESSDWWSLGHLIYYCYKGGFLLQPVKIGVKDLLAEIDYRLQLIKDGKEPVINRMVERGLTDVVKFIQACFKLDMNERTYNNIIVEKDDDV
ncbi:6270_t:CDS:10 [Funneliformis mosseae]|uniref:non-specific serine/threonine protein kinase n=1 Tax=Funneliformis mosseae TaxID=27381 RepID=A0A9N9AG03_FUNMO|nr:6270_t:CDS:10 [Funneliformis mosseae]